ncbi:MAG: YqgE/AlgH family protein [Muribaculaceae bacterium]|nr:YqgE/AlgH family protein [Muribaculaceae bacterium]
MKDTNENIDTNPEKINADPVNDDTSCHVCNKAHEVRRGTILVSSPFLADPNFKRTSILILDKDSKGGFIGLILNRKLNIDLEDVFNIKGRNSVMRLQEGGPVDLQRIFWIHSLGNKLKEAIEILPGLYVGGDYDDMIAQIFNSEVNLSNKIRFYLGYSGWNPGQLEKEIESGAWGVLTDMLDPQLVLELEGDELWNQLCLRLGSDYRHWRIFPADPNLN